MQITIQELNRSIEGEYLIRCAKMRNITTSALIRKLISTIARDQLVLAILDDEDQEHRHRRYERKFRDPRNQTAA